MDQDTRKFAAGELPLAFERKVQVLQIRYCDFLRKYGVEVDLPGKSEDSSPTAKRRLLFKIMKHRLMVTGMSAQKCRYDGLDPASPQRENARMHSIRLLWFAGLWRSPWNDLLYQEFPGKQFGPVDMESILFPPGKVTTESRSADLISEEMLKLLKGAGYSLGGNTSIITFELSLLALLNQNRLEPDPRLAIRYQAKEIIRGETTSWYDEAWSAVLDKYFPKK